MLGPTYSPAAKVQSSRSPYPSPYPVKSGGYGFSNTPFSKASGNLKMFNVEVILVNAKYKKYEKDNCKKSSVSQSDNFHH